jgi:predicted nucleotidyltransferase
MSALAYLESRKEQVAELCERFGVRRLRIFGSALGESWDPQTSDIDFLVEFDRLDRTSAFDQVLGFKVALEEVLGKEVDLVDLRLSRNPYFKENVESVAKIVYAA